MPYLLSCTTAIVTGSADFGVCSTHIEAGWDMKAPSEYTIGTRAQSDTELSKHCPCHPLNLFHYTCLHHSMVMHRQMVSFTLRSKSKQKRLLCMYEKSWFKEGPVCINNESIVTVI